MPARRDFWKAVCGRLDGFPEKIYTRYDRYVRVIGKEYKMGFVNSFMTSLLLLLIFVVVGGAAVFLGITLRRNANAKAEKTNDTQTAKEA